MHVSPEATPPADWYPDPENPSQLRYWDGTAWTEHRAPVPQAPEPAQAAAPMQVQHTAQAEAQYAQQQTAPYAAQPGPYAQLPAQYAAQPGQYAPQPLVPRGPSAWTRGTIITLVVCLVLVFGAAAGAVAFFNHSSTAHERQANEALEGFVSNSVKGDAKWRDFANQKLLDKVVLGSPILGESTTAKALDLKIDYELGPLIFQSDLPNLPADLAHAKLKLTYTFSLDGVEATSTAYQTVWLSRPFYYGDDVPARATGQEPSAIGPWRVTSLVLPTDGESGGNEGTEYFKTDIEVPFIEDVDDTYCFAAPNLLEDVSTASRTEAEVRSFCFWDEGSIALGDNVDLDDMAMSFPPIDAMQASQMPPELVQLDPGMAYQSAPPLREYLIRGASGTYVLTLIGVQVTGDAEQTTSNRIVSIQMIEEDAS